VPHESVEELVDRAQTDEVGGGVFRPDDLEHARERSPAELSVPKRSAASSIQAAARAMKVRGTYRSVDETLFPRRAPSIVSSLHLVELFRMAAISSSDGTVERRP
jgi:hypothetical protein